MKTEPIFLRFAFDFTDSKGNTIKHNISHSAAVAIPLDVDAKVLNHYEGAILRSAIGDMIVELIQSGQINHLCPQILDKAPTQLKENDSTTHQQLLPVVVFDAQIVDKEQIFQSGLGRGKMKLEKWGGPFAPDSKD
jgi:hypothetical protein